MENKHLDNTDLQPRKWLLYVLIVVSIIIGIVLATKVITDNQNKKDEEWSIIDKFFDTFGGAFNNITNNNGSSNENNYVSEFEKKAFNSKLELYVGTNWGAQLSHLIDIITTNNKTNTEHILTVVYGSVNTTDVDEIRNIKNSLGNWDEYEVIFDYDENGFINLITIEK